MIRNFLAELGVSWPEPEDSQHAGDEESDEDSGSTSGSDSDSEEETEGAVGEVKKETSEETLGGKGFNCFSTLQSGKPSLHTFCNVEMVSPTFPCFQVSLQLQLLSPRKWKLVPPQPARLW